MKYIYLVSEGSYSDYHIVAAFESEEKAKEFVTLREGVERFSDYGVEKHPVVDSVENYKMENYEIIYGQLDTKGKFETGTMIWDTVQSPKEEANSTRFYVAMGMRCEVRIRRIKTERTTEEYMKKVCAEKLAELKYLIKAEGLTSHQAVSVMNLRYKGE